MNHSGMSPAFELSFQTTHGTTGELFTKLSLGMVTNIHHAAAVVVVVVVCLFCFTRS